MLKTNCRRNQSIRSRRSKLLNEHLKYILMIENQEHLKSEDIDRLPLRAFEGQIVVVTDSEGTDKAVQNLQKAKVLGFDTETRPIFKKGVTRNLSLLQLYDGEKAYLFRINSMGFPNSLKKIMQDPKIIKVGAAIRDDIKALAKLNHFKPEGFVDLQAIAKLLQIEDISVKKLTARILEFKISKKQQLSNWDNEILDTAQITYAATDAWVCYLLYFEMMKLQEQQQTENQ